MQIKGEDEKQRGLSVNARVEFLDIAKGIGIILVVWAHAKGPYTRYIYQFHMPLFFLISGFLHNDRNTVAEFIKSKIRSIYIPFIIWNLAVIVLKTCQNPELLKKNLILIIQVILTLNKDGQFFGATWFLGALFIVSIAYKLLDEYIQDAAWKRIVIMGIFIAIACVAFEIKFPLMLSRTLILGMFYAIGYFIKCYQNELKVFDCKCLAVLASIMFGMLGYYNSVNMGANEYKYPFAFVFGALLASYVVIFLSREIEKKQYIWIVKKFVGGVCYLGRKSIHIVIWQFVAFRIVIALQMIRDGESLRHILNYYPVYDANGYWWMVYTFVGLFVPIFWGNVCDTIFDAIKGCLKECFVM